MRRLRISPGAGLRVLLWIVIGLGTVGSSVGQPPVVPACASGTKPVIELLPIAFDGGVPDALRHSELRFSEDFWRSWGWLELRSKYSCVDWQLIERDAYSGEIRRLGAKGIAKYEIRGLAQVMLEERIVPVLHRSGWNGRRRTEESLELVTARGRVRVDFELISKVSGAVFDRGQYLIDWVPRPPGDDSYEAPPDRMPVIDGKVYQAADALFFGESTPEPSIEHVPVLDSGDPGLTIRRRETPHFLRSSFGMSGGEVRPMASVLFVLDERGELLPDGVEVALRWGEGSEQVVHTRDGTLLLAELPGFPGSCAETRQCQISVRRADDSAAVPVTIPLVDPAALGSWVSIEVRSHRSRHAKDPSRVDSCTEIHSFDLEETREAAFLFEIGDEPQVERLDSGHELQRYELLGKQITDAFFLRDASEGEERICAVPEGLSSCSRHLSGRAGPLGPSPDGSGKYLVLVVDPEDRRVLEVRLPRIVFPLAWSGRSLCRTREFLPLRAGSSQWDSDEFAGDAEANETYSSFPDRSVIREIGEDSSCFTPRAPESRRKLSGGCKAQRVEDGWRLESSYEWMISLR